MRLRALVRSEREILGSFVPKDGAAVVDVGTGEGRIAVDLVTTLGVRPSSLFLVDINIENLEIARRRFPLRELPNLVVVEGNVMERLPLGRDQFDVSIALGDVLALASGGSIEDGIRECLRVTKKGGLLIFSIPTIKALLITAYRRGEQREVKKSIRKTGVYPNWNNQFGEGLFKSVPRFRSWVALIETHHGVELVQRKRVNIDHPFFASRQILVLRKL